MIHEEGGREVGRSGRWERRRERKEGVEKREVDKDKILAAVQGVQRIGKRS